MQIWNIKSQPLEVKLPKLFKAQPFNGNMPLDMAEKKAKGEEMLLGGSMIGKRGRLCEEEEEEEEKRRREEE
jgi:hypothetical protein